MFIEIIPATYRIYVAQPERSFLVTVFAHLRSEAYKQNNASPFNEIYDKLCHEDVLSAGIVLTEREAMLMMGAFQNIIPVVQQYPRGPQMAEQFFNTLKTAGLRPG